MQGVLSLLRMNYSNAVGNQTARTLGPDELGSMAQLVMERIG